MNMRTGADETLLASFRLHQFLISVTKTFSLEEVVNSELKREIIFYPIGQKKRESVSLLVQKAQSKLIIIIEKHSS